MNRFFVILCALLSVFSLIAQNRVLLHGHGTASVFSTIGAAYNAAVDGDTIYISGGKYAESLGIDKPNLVILGVGFNEDSCRATGITEIQGNISLNSNADNGKLQGLYIAGYLRIADLDHYEISRNRVEGNLDFRYHTFLHGLWITENVLNGFYMSYSNGKIHYAILEKNIIYGSIYNLDEYCSVNNNVILTEATPFSSCNNLLIENNIIYSRNNNPLFLGGIEYQNYFSNNIFVMSKNYQQEGYGNALFVDNHYVDTAEVEKVFVEYDKTFVYNLKNDFTLNADSASVWKGTDNTPIGLYGTKTASGEPTPYKKNTLPFTPHISEKSVAKFTNESGALEIHYQVKAQLK